jgi:hypothetical protein
VEHTRLTLFTADPARTGDLARFLGRDVVRRLDDELGSGCPGTPCAGQTPPPAPISQSAPSMS